MHFRMVTPPGGCHYRRMARWYGGGTETNQVPTGKYRKLLPV